MRFGQSGVHFFDRHTGKNILLDEVRVSRKAWAAAPRYVSIALTNACQLSCPYCYAPKKPGSLDFDRLTDWLLKLDSNGCLGIGFGGGEPTQYRRFTDACRFAAQETQLAVTFTTHGHNIDKRLVTELDGSIHFARVSMDGVDSTYEELRGRSFTALIDGIQLLSGIVPFGINFVVNNRTFPDLDCAIKLAADLGASEFLLLPEQPVRSQGGIDGTTNDQLRGWVRSYQGTVPLTISEAGAEDIDVTDPLLGEQGLQRFAHIDAFGVLKQSSYEQFGISIGAGCIMGAICDLKARIGDNLQ